MKKKNKILFISGPTTSGKSNLAIRIAKKIKGEIVNADSMQVYKELKIITARPLLKDQKKIKHHLYGHRLGNIRYNVYDWCKEASKKIYEISKNNKIPIGYMNLVDISKYFLEVSLIQIKCNKLIIQIVEFRIS